MPTYERTARFIKDFKELTSDEKTLFKKAVKDFVEDLRAQRPFRNGLRVKGIQGAKGIFEMSWAPDGRATFQYGPERQDGEPHIIWRRVGTHEIFDSPK